MESGGLVSLNYAMITGASIDPMEKKPLYHFMPGSSILSIGTFGCNMGCSFCQNWEISQSNSGGTYVEPEALAELAQKYQSQSVGVAYTYSEPSVWYDYVLECAVMVKAAGLCNVLVTNGFINPEPLIDLLPFIDAMNVDLKSIHDQFYRDICKARLQPVLDTIRLAVEKGCHVELTTLVIPGMNDSADEIDKLAAWVAGLSREIPLHLSRYFPCHKLDVEQTPIATLKSCAGVARTHLDYVYIGNAATTGGSDTLCPRCGTLLIERRGFARPEVHVDTPACPACGLPVPLVLCTGNGATRPNN